MVAFEGFLQSLSDPRCLWGELGMLKVLLFQFIVLKVVELTCAIELIAMISDKLLGQARDSVS